METREYLPSDDEASILSELQQLENALSDGFSFSSHEDGCPARDDTGVAIPADGKQRKVVYKVTLQPRLSETAQGPAIPPQYTELFERLQPRIIARGLASDSESFLALNRSLRPKAVSSNSRQTLMSPGTEKQTPLRMLGGRRMPREAPAADRQLMSWSVKHKGSLSLPRTPKTGCASPEIHNQGLKKPLPPRLGITKSERRMSFGDLDERNTQHRGSADRPFFARRTPTQFKRSPCDESEDDKAHGWAPEQCYPLESSYRNYSRQIFRNARKLQSFCSEESPETPELLRQPIGKQPGHFRSNFVDFSGTKRDLGWWSTPENFVLNSPSTSCATTLSEEEEEAFFRNSMLLCDTKRFGSMQGQVDTESAAMKSSSRVADDPPRVSRESLIPTSTPHGLNAPSLDSRAAEWSPSSSRKTGISSQREFDSEFSKCSDVIGKRNVTNSGTKTESQPHTNGFIQNSVIEMLFETVARISGHPETQMKHETSIVLTEKTRQTPIQPDRIASNTLTDEAELSSSNSCSTETDSSKLTDEGSTNAEAEWAPEHHSSSWQEDENGTNVMHYHDSASLSEPDATWSCNFPDGGDQRKEAERHEVYMPEMSSKFISKVTVLLRRRPGNQQNQLDQQPRTYSPTGCRIKQLAYGQLKPIPQCTL